MWKYVHSDNREKLLLSSFWFDCIHAVITFVVSITFGFTHLIDIDECALDMHQCSQNCHNTVGSYICNCRAGYRLNADGHSCDGRLSAAYSPSLISSFHRPERVFGTNTPVCTGLRQHHWLLLLQMQ